MIFNLWQMQRNGLLKKLTEPTEVAGVPESAAFRTNGEMALLLICYLRRYGLYIAYAALVATLGATVRKRGHESENEVQLQWPMPCWG